MQGDEPDEPEDGLLEGSEDPLDPSTRPRVRRQPKLLDVWGAELGGNCRDDSRTVEIVDSDIGPETVLTIEGRGSAAALDPTTVTPRPDPS